MEKLPNEDQDLVGGRLGVSVETERGGPAGMETPSDNRAGMIG